MAYKKRTDGKRHTLQRGEYVRKSDGRYCYKFQNPLTGKSTVIYAETLTELREKERELADSLQNGIDVAEARLKNLNDYFYAGMKLKEKEGTLKGTTRMNYERLWDKHLKAFGAAKAAGITTMQVRKVIADLKAEGLSKATIKILTNLMSQSFDDAISCRARLDNPMLDKKVKTARKNAGSVKIVEALTPDEQDRLMQFVENSNVYGIYADMLTVVLYTGLRVGEFTGLTWNDVDLKEGILKVDHQLKYGKQHKDDKTHFFIEQPKTEAGIRTLYIVDEVKRALQNIRKLNFMLGRHCDVVIDGYSDFIFLTKNGTPFATNAINFILDNIVRAHNRGNPETPLPHISAHVLRHCYGTRAVENGMDYQALRESMGHTDISVTLNIYAKPNDEEWKREQQRKISNA